ncbi:MAG: hypothetical protein CHACPFDD_02162 [Phycisphaerae bacterium]|nr:hypothetical protein [Phycisphaerae bacterium]
MNWAAIVKRIDPATARAFVSAARAVIDAMLIEGERVRQAQAPARRDYGSAGLPADAPAGGWISDSEVRSAAQKMSEALAAEKWVEGVMFAIKALSALGAV